MINLIKHEWKREPVFLLCTTFIDVSYTFLSVETMKPVMMAEESSDDNTSTNSKDSTRIIIIRAGISGIMAGNILAKEGYDDFVILEASNRTGGRIWSVDLGKTRLQISCILLIMDIPRMNILERPDIYPLLYIF